MRFRLVLLIASSTALLSVAISSESAGQIKWTDFSPTDKRFSVKLPKKPKYLRVSPKSDEGGLLGLFEGSTAADTYDFSPDESGTVGVVVVLHLARTNTRRQFDKEADSDMEMVGGDDKTFIKRASVIVSGLHGREYVYRKGSVRGRVLIVNAGKRVFFLQYHTGAGVLPRFVDEIFRSFRLAT